MKRNRALDENIISIVIARDRSDIDFFLFQTTKEKNLRLCCAYINVYNIIVYSFLAELKSSRETLIKVVVAQTHCLTFVFF